MHITYGNLYENVQNADQNLKWKRAKSPYQNSFPMNKNIDRFRFSINDMIRPLINVQTYYEPINYAWEKKIRQIQTNNKWPKAKFDFLSFLWTITVNPLLSKMLCCVLYYDKIETQTASYKFYSVNKNHLLKLCVNRFLLFYWTYIHKWKWTEEMNLLFKTNIIHKKAIRTLSILLFSTFVKDNRNISLNLMINWVIFCRYIFFRWKHNNSTQPEIFVIINNKTLRNDIQAARSQFTRICTFVFLFSKTLTQWERNHQNKELP